MATLKQIIYAFKNIRARGAQSDDSQLSDHQVMFLIDQYRAKLIRQDVDKGKPLNPALVQDLGFISVAPANYLFNTDKVAGESIYVTEVQLPQMIETTQKNLWTHVGPNPVSLPFQRTTLSKIVWDLHSPYTSKLPKWFEHERKLYAYVPKQEDEELLTEIFAMGVAESPYAIMEFKQELNYADPYDFEYPISISMLDVIYKLIADAELKMLMSMKADLINDGNEE